jgi:hypothetical protein
MEDLEEQGCAASLLARILDNKKRVYISWHGLSNLLVQIHAQKEG